jgi:hypothetical protein
MFGYTCPFCSQRLLAPPDRAGHKTICPKCLRPLTIPDPNESLEHDPNIDMDVPLLQVAHNDSPSDVNIGGHEPVLVDADSVFASGRPTPMGVQPPLSRPAPSTKSPTVKREPAYRPEPARPKAAAEKPLPETRRPAPTQAPASPPRHTPLPTANGPRPVANRLPRHETGMVSLVPTGLAGVDIGAELTAALTMRMKPPPDPPADLALSTGGWLLLSGFGFAFWIAGVLYSVWLLQFVAIIGVLMLAFSYFWSSYLAGRHNLKKGLVTLMPPVAFLRMWLPFGDNGYRPLRFALTGGFFIVLYFLGYPAREWVSGVAAQFEFQRKDADTRPKTSVERFRADVEEKQYENINTDVINFTLPEYRADVAEDEKPVLIALLRDLTLPSKCDRVDIRTKATTALIDWSPDEGRLAVLRSLVSTESQERRHALTLAARWSDDEMAIAVANRLTLRSEEAAARDALAKMPNTAVEVGLLTKLKTEDQIAILTIAEMLEKVGGPKSIEALIRISKQPEQAIIKDQLLIHVEAIQKRLK